MDTLHHLKLEIAGLRLDLCTSSAPVAGFLADYFRYYSHPEGPAQLSISIDPASPSDFDVPAQAELISQNGVVEFFTTADGKFYLRTDITFFEVHPAEGRARGWFRPKALEFHHLLVNTYIYAALVLLLRQNHIYHLHAAAVLSPSGNMALISGPQRSGKSTLTAAFAASGWKAISDDGLLLSNSPEPGFSAYLRDFHISNSLMGNWDFFRNAETRYSYLDRSCLDGLSLTGSLEAAKKRYEKVSAVLFPVVSAEESSRLEPLDPGDAMLYLIEQSMFFALWQEYANEQVQILAAILNGAKFYRFHSGRDVWSTPGSVAGILP